MKSLIIILIFFFLGAEISAQEPLKDTIYLHGFPALEKNIIEITYTTTDICLADSLVKDLLLILMEKQIKSNDLLITELNQRGHKINKLIFKP